MVRIGGELRDPSKDYSQADARGIFLKRIEQLAPVVLRSLRSDVFPAFQRAVEADLRQAETVAAAGPLGGTVVRDRNPIWFGLRWTEWTPPADPEEWSPERLQAREALLAWAERFNLAEPWMFDVTLRTLRFWNARAERPTLEALPLDDAKAPRFSLRTDALRARREALETLVTWSGESREDSFADPYFMDAARAERFRFEFPGWVPQWKPWEDWNRELEARLVEALGEYRERIEHEVAETGLIPSPEKRARGGDDPFQHFDWFVRFQVQKWSLKGLAIEYRKAEKTVQGAIKEISTLVGVTRRSVR